MPKVNPKKFEQSQAEMRHHLERTNAERRTVKKTFVKREELRMQAPQVLRQKAGEAQLSTRVSTMSYKHSCCASESMDVKRNLGFAQQTSKFELSRVQLHLRSSVERDHFTETRDAEEKFS